jgi:NAD(P)-dependent dehydrogenase (short-subunit alcohol dehydrogenase family)
MTRAEDALPRGVVVTGGAQGIGKAVAARFRDEGFGVVVLDLDGTLVERAAEALTTDTGQVLAITGDVVNREDLRRAITTCVERFGGLDALVAVAGIAIGAPFLRVSDADWLHVVDVNINGVFRSIQEAATVMAKDRGGAIVVMTSTNAVHVEQNLAPYNTSKGAEVSLVRSAAMDLAKFAIRVNAVAPGVVRTRGAEWLTEDPELASKFLAHTPLGRFAEPEDVADAVFFLASPAASYITGQTLTVDGGCTLGDTYEDREVASPFLSSSPK